MNADDQKLRDENLSFYFEDIEKIDKVLSNFLTLSKAKSVFLIDKSGSMITYKGENQSINVDELSALVAASFAATKEIARLLGEAEFTVMFHQGKKDNIHISLIGNKAISVTLFGDDTTVGMIGHYSKELSHKLASIFEIISKRIVRHQEQIAGDLGAFVENKLNELFKVYPS
ncbi:MAG: roadblock/LC7 domain-containing protein [Nitrospinae bacterium]|nr:roadblock/LC7 domain-containing protein [Nitrospinota bacterium]